MGFFSLKKNQNGSLPLASYGRAAFPFRATEGHNPDLYPAGTPFPAQTNQYTYFNAFYGNQLPNFSCVVPVIETQQQVNRPWYTQTNVQQQNAFQTQHSGQAPLIWGQQPTANYISSLAQFWAGLSGGKGK